MEIRRDGVLLVLATETQAIWFVWLRMESVGAVSSMNRSDTMNVTLSSNPLGPSGSMRSRFGEIACTLTCPSRTTNPHRLWLALGWVDGAKFRIQHNSSVAIFQETVSVALCRDDSGTIDKDRCNCVCEQLCCGGHGILDSRSSIDPPRPRRPRRGAAARPPRGAGAAPGRRKYQIYRA